LKNWGNILKMLLYIHIPYCDSKCSYCSFNSYVGKFATREKYMKALQTQFIAELEKFRVASGNIETVFIGGGTPSTVPPELYAPLFGLFGDLLSPDAEISCEANPNSAGFSWLKGMRELGVNRISFGVQSFDSGKLHRLHRNHTPVQALRAVENAASAGFENISIDLLYNCAGDDRQLLQKDIGLALSLPISHISAYELTIEEGTPFARMPDMHMDSESMARFVSETIVSLGMPSYEVSNFGRPCRHNMGYWKLEDYIGLGAGAVGSLGNTRFYPPPSIDDYIANPLYCTKESISEKSRRTEAVFLGLRSCIGIDENIFTDSMKRKADLLCREKKLFRRNGRCYNPDFFLADELSLYLME